MDIKERIISYGRKVKDGVLTWQKAVEMFNQETGLNLSKEAFRCRYKNTGDKYNNKSQVQNEEYEVHNEDGTIELCKEVWFNANEIKTPEMILKSFGYSTEEWELVSWSFGKWEVAIKDEEQNRICTTIRAKIKPRQKKEITLENYIKIAQEEFSKNIIPIKVQHKESNKELDNNKLLELPGMELHLGKMAWSGDTGQDYDKDIAQERFCRG